MSSSSAHCGDDAEERQLLVTQVRDKAVLSMEDLGSMGSPTSSGFVSGSLDEEAADDDDDELAYDGGKGGANTPEAIKFRRRYREMLRRSREEDLSSIEETNAIYQAGYDKQGRAVVVFIGKWFRQSQIDLEKAFLYLLRVLEPIAGHDYVVFYFHTRTSRDNIPSYWYIKEVYNTLPYKFKKNLKKFFVVHPTVWTKMTCWWFSTFMAPAIKNKIQNVHALEELRPVVDHKDLSIPMFVTEQDMIFNGLRFYQP